MTAITSMNLANAIVKLVAVDALPALIGQLVVGNLVHRDFEPTTWQAGDSVGVPVCGSQPGEVGIDLTSHIEATFQIPDVTKVIAVPDLLRLYMQPAMVALAERVESDLLRLWSRFTANAPVGAVGVALTDETLDAAETSLFGKGDDQSPRYLVVTPYAYSHLRQMQSFSEYNSAGDAGLRALVEGPVGRWRNLFVFRSPFVHRSDVGKAHNLAFLPKAMAIAIRRLPKPLPGTGGIAEYAELGNFGMRVVMNYQPNTLAQQFTVDMLYGVKVLSPEQGVQVLS